MAASSLPLTSLSEAQWTQAQDRFLIIHPALNKEITQVEIVRTHQISARTIQRWIKNYREKGLAGFADTKTRSDKDKSRRLPADAITLIEGLVLQNSPRSAASLHRQVSARATEQGWKPPSYARVCQIIKNIDPPS
ncbi:MAG TPA: helix-turn-helix domain-containing protein [Ktedonobacteraceae bacterium]|jgi:putative transposase